jgi:hypothetical protein
METIMKVLGELEYLKEWLNWPKGKKMKKLVGIKLHGTPPSSLMDSTTSPKVTTMEGEGVGVRSLAYNILGVEGCVGTLGWGLKRLTRKLITYTDLHKPNNKLVSA